MPGVLGVFSSKPIDRSTASHVEELLPHLSAEPDYSCVSCLSNDYADAAIFASSSSPFSVHHRQSDVVVYGEVFCGAVPANTMFAQQLANCTPETFESILQKFDGSWCGCVWWSHLRCGALFVDHCGSKPIFYAMQDGCLWFAPEPKGLAGAGLNVTLDRTAVASYLTVGHVLCDQTFYTEVKSLSPGAFLQFDSSGVHIRQYYEYRLSESDAEDKGEPVYTERLHQAMRVAIERRVPRLAEAVIPISGGWDSRGILAYAKTFDVPLKTVSWGTNEDDKEADAALGRRVAKHFGTKHCFLQRRPERFPSTIEEMVSRVDALTMDPAFHYQEVEFMRRIRDEVGARYLLRGDEVFGYMLPADTEVQALGRIGIRQMSDYPDLLAVVRADVRQELISAVDGLIHRVSERCLLRDYTARKDYHYFYERLFNYLHRATYYKQTVLDVSNPWLDKSIMEVNSIVPLRYRVDKQLYKAAISRQFPDIPIPIAVRSSLESWPAVIAGSKPISSFISDHLRQRNSPIYEFLAPERINAIVDSLAAGKSKQIGSVRLVESAKHLLRSISPSLFNLVRKGASGKLQIAAVSPVDIVFRTLVLKLWFDRHGPRTA